MLVDAFFLHIIWLAADTIGECVLAVMRERYAKLHKYRKKGWMKDERQNF